MDSKILSFIKKTAFILLKLNSPKIYKEKNSETYMKELSDFF